MNPALLQTPLPQDLLPQTPLQRALQGDDAQAVWLATSKRLATLRQQVLQQLDQGLAPGDYARCRQLLAMCEAALRVLQTLSPTATETPPLGPAAGLLPRPVIA
ncbi:hypothetical protein [Aquabacterium sp.]|uniref:hypothetical protein n=1 Tax=Aquabacterium sp. TaxID=1872578 RepID=UPI002C73C811|nr:hypothetical protein [Aquabacterium sp.]HSW03473.1 hypothetical protein [Aquabacterium sp.]